MTTHDSSDPQVAKRPGAGNLPADMAKAFLAVVVVVALLFWLAGSAAWPGAWAYMVIAGAASAVYVAGLRRDNPDLLVARSGGFGAPDTPAWDKVVAGLGAGLLPFASWVVSALDRRFVWAPEAPAALQALGGASLVLGWAVFLWAVFSNRFFASTVQLQQDHAVQTGGPYRWVRHPGYLGLLIYQPAAALLLGSWWGLAVALCSVPLIVLRTILEDRWLRDRLPGYRDYAASVPHRLLPGIW